MSKPRKALVRDGDQYMMRLPEGMRDRIKARADSAGRSMAAEIICALEQYLDKPSLLNRVERIERYLSL